MLMFANGRRRRDGLARGPGLCLYRLKRDDPPRRALFERTSHPTGHVDFGVLVGRQEGVFE